MVLNGEGRELVVESLASAALEPDRLFAYRHDRTQQSSRLLCLKIQSYTQKYMSNNKRARLIRDSLLRWF